jgi:RNase P subunit RPR2
MQYKYSRKEEQVVDHVLGLIASRSKNAALGYTPAAKKHVEKNRVELPKTNESYFCPDCGKAVKFGAKFCGNCGYRLDWNSMRK